LQSDDSMSVHAAVASFNEDYPRKQVILESAPSTPNVPKPSSIYRNGRPSDASISAISGSSMQGEGPDSLLSRPATTNAGSKLPDSITKLLAQFEQEHTQTMSSLYAMLIQAIDAENSRGEIAMLSRQLIEAKTKISDLERRLSGSPPSVTIETERSQYKGEL
jgi:hypothetical protein